MQLFLHCCCVTDFVVGKLYMTKKIPTTQRNQITTQPTDLWCSGCTVVETLRHGASDEESC